MAPSPAPAAEEDAAATAAAAASASGSRRRGRRSIIRWGTVFCFASRREGCLQDQEAAVEVGTPWQRSRRRKRTVPVDGDVVARTADDPEATARRGGGAAADESRKGLGVHGCCFLPPAPVRMPRRQQLHGQNRASLSLQHNTVDSAAAADNKQRRVERTEQPPPTARSGSEKNSPSAEAPAPSRAHRAEQPRGAPAETRAPTPATKARGGGARSSNSEASASEACAKAPAGRAGAGAFGPVVGLSVVAAVSMAGLLGGRVWAVACVCAWLAALSRLRQRNAPAAGAGSDGGQEVAVDVDSTDYKKRVVLRGLLERDRTKAVSP